MARNKDRADEEMVEGLRREVEGAGENLRSLELVNDFTASSNGEASGAQAETGDRQASDRLESYRAEFQQRHRTEPTDSAEARSGGEKLDSLFELFLGPRGRRSIRPDAEESKGLPVPGQRFGPSSGSFVGKEPEDARIPPMREAERAHPKVDEWIDPLRSPAGEAQSQPAQELYTRAVESVQNWIKGAEARTLPGVESGVAVAEEIVRALEYDSALLLAATDRFQEFSVAAHSVNVAILSVRFTGTMGRARQFQERVCLAALLHEIGVARLPRGLMYKKDPLSPEAVHLLRSRPLLSAEVLQGFGEPSGDLAEIVGQVFERANGSGSPLGRKGNEIREEARILGIIDALETCIHSRPYRKAFTGYQTLQEFSTDPAAPFSDDEVKTLIRSVSLFPYNELLRLSNGEVARVVDINREQLSRPIVEVVSGKPGPVPNASNLVNLAESPSLQISEVISLERLAQP